MISRSFGRRGFFWLTAALLAGWTGLADRTSSSLPSEALDAEAPIELPPWWPPPGPINPAPPIATQGGRVLAIRGNDLIISSGNHEVALEVSSQTIYCDGSWVCDVPVDIGDDVVVGGTPAGFDRFNVDRLWVNATNLQGEVIAVPSSTVPPFTIVMNDRYDDRRPESEKPHRVVIDPRTWWAPVLTGRFQPVGNEALPVVVGGFIGIVGRVEDAAVLAASIFDLRGKE